MDGASHWGGVYLDSWVGGHHHKRENIVPTRRTIGTIIAASALTGAAAIGLTGTAAAAGGCPSGDGWTLASTGIFIDQLDNGNAADQNGDGLACFKVNKGQTDKHDGVASFTWKDNTN